MKSTPVVRVKKGDAPGSIDFRGLEGELKGCGYICPKCGEEDYMPIDSERGWVFSGTMETPTLRPSILHRPCGWHGYLTNGNWEEV